MTDINASVCLSPTTGTAPLTFAAALQYFAAAQCLLSDQLPKDSDVKDNASYDFIIVGGGTAGCVLATRLSEIKTWKVLLIEAGPYPPVETKVPALDKGLFGSKYDWQYYSQNDNVTSQGIVNGSVYWPRGKMLGGCSNINAMIYVKGNTEDYQRWYDAGNKDWDVNTVKKYFNKAESLQDQKLVNNIFVGPYYGKTGPLTINTFNSTYRDICDKVLESYNEMGIFTVADLNVANVMGSGIVRVTAADGRRCSTDHTYLNPVRYRENLHVLTDTLVTKVNIGTFLRKVAEGVEVERNGTKMKFYASKEVILSAGAINSPQLLMLSGIGPRKHLEEKNLTCLVDSPAVGQYLQDHLKIPVTIYGNQPHELNQAKQQFEAIQYLYNRTGYLAQCSIGDISSFYARNFSFTYPEFETNFILHWMNSTSAGGGFANNFKFKPSIVQSVVEQNKDNALYVLLFSLLHPYSRGSISLNTSNPKDYPLIFTNYFSDPRDLESVVAGIKKLTKIVKTKYFQDIGGHLGRMKWAPCDNYELDSTDYWKCIATNTATTVYHPVGTTRMGKNIDTSVVSSNLKVHNCDNLRVVDAGVMPSHVSGNTNGPVVMVAERASDLVKNAYFVS